MLSYNLAPPVLEMNSADVKSFAGQQPTAVDKKQRRGRSGHRWRVREWSWKSLHKLKFLNDLHIDLLRQLITIISRLD